MTGVDLPEPTVRAAAADEDIDRAALERDLHARVDAEVRFDAGSRAAYSTDASNYRQVPIGVVLPRTTDAAIEALAVCREHDVPVLSRGGGTSLAGQCTNTAVIIDFSKYCHRVHSVDVMGRTCWVEPGIVLDVLNTQLAEHGLQFGPEPATHNHCTLGGMIGNNSCGATAQRTGKVVDNTIFLEVLLYDGTRMRVGETSDEEYVDVVRAGGRRGEVYRALRELRERYGEEVSAEYPNIPRRVSGYNLDSLLEQQGFDIGKALVGSESTCVMVLGAQLKLLPVVAERAAVLLGYPDVGSSGDAVPAVLEHNPIALEGFDDKVLLYQQRKGMNPTALALLPEGPKAWLLVQFGADTAEEAKAKARGLADAVAGGPTVTVFDDAAQQRQIWAVREAALGATAQVAGMANMWPGWEDSAVAPEKMGEYLRALTALYDEFGYSDASLYGHYGQGCIHTRIPFDLRTAEGVATFREFMQRAARLVVSLGGSLSGEHGDGQSRAELLPIMYSENIIRAFSEFKAIFDPDNRMNPGKMTRPYAIDDDLRLGAGYRPKQLRTTFRFPEDEGDFVTAALRCVGVGRCRRHEGGVMCPSYMVTKDEEHSTRGRARVLFEMLQGHPDSPITEGWRSPAVKDALDLCLSCKGCKKDCPVNVDMATYKAEFLSHHYAGRLRPLAHYSMGWLPLLARVASRVPRVVNAVTQAPGLSRLATLAAGVAPQREIPQFAPQTFQHWFVGRSPRGGGERGEVLLWPDTFSNSFHPHLAQAAVEVLEDAGWRVVVPTEAVCCGLTWISTGQLDVAKKILQRTVDVLRPHLRAGTLVLGLEPSCTAVFRSDAIELFPEDADVQRLQRQTVTLAELLTELTPGWEPPRSARHALIQTHCHQHAIMGFEADEKLLAAMGIDAEVLDSGCCGLAGNFGFEKGHYEVPEACGERVLFPALRTTEPTDVILADGFSCRTQIEQGNTGGRQAVHLAELLAAALHADDGGAYPERDCPRPHTPKSTTYAALAATTGIIVAAMGVLVRRVRPTRRW